jgi:predicted ATP-grasp superfamily ATP-dependent carboligase
MPRVFVYEYFTATDPNPDPADSLYREGRAMYDAVREDLRAVPGVEVLETGSEDPPDFALIIAPETDGVLESIVRRAEARGIPLLGPSSDAIRLTADKLALAGHWQSAGVPTPPTWPPDRGFDCPFPRVLKPRDGCGSGGIRVANDEGSYSRAVREISDPDRWIVQPLVPGIPVSVSFLIGPTARIALPPALQSVSPDTHFRYDGGELPIPPGLAGRATRLAERVVRSVPGLFGYVGVDLVLGPAPDGSDDAAVEINPRLTTSYVGLRASAGTNLMSLLLTVCSGHDPDPVRWRPGRVRFRPDGGADFVGV